MARHEIKIWSDWYTDIASGRKSFEYRRDDRGYAVGDILHMIEFRPAPAEYTGRWIDAEVTYMMRSSHTADRIGFPEGYCIMGIKVIRTGHMAQLLAAMEEIRTRSAGADVEGLEHGCERTVLATIHAIASRAIARLAFPLSTE
jgi:Domain of unknown function (DUF3850)